MNPQSVDKVLQRYELSNADHQVHTNDALLSAPTPEGEDPAKVPELRSYAVRPLIAHESCGDSTPYAGTCAGFESHIQRENRGGGPL